MLNSEEIKPLAIAIIELRLSERISKERISKERISKERISKEWVGQSVSRKFD